MTTHAITVKELISELMNYDEDLPVVTLTNPNGAYESVTGTEQDKVVETTNHPSGATHEHIDVVVINVGR